MHRLSHYQESFEAHLWFSALFGEQVASPGMNLGGEETGFGILVACSLGGQPGRLRLFCFFYHLIFQDPLGR